MSKFEANDSWIFLSVAHGHGEARPALDKVIGIADSINKDTPSRAEIGGAINRLSSKGLIRVEDGYFVVTELGRSILEKIRQSAKTVFVEWEMLETHLKTAQLRDVKYSQWKLSVSDFERAIEVYRKDFAKALEKLNRASDIA